MMELKEQVAYLRGLIEGQEFQGERDGILWTQLLNICDLISLEIENMRDDHAELKRLWSRRSMKTWGIWKNFIIRQKRTWRRIEDLIEG